MPRPTGIGFSGIGGDQGIAQAGQAQAGQAMDMAGIAANQEQARNSQNQQIRSANKAGNMALGSTVGAIGGMAAGAEMGSAGGPWGAAIGAIAGGLMASSF